MNFKATEEQVKAVELVNEFRTLKLNALAGASKTTTCTLIAKANPVQSLYLAYNKTMAEDAKGRFPDHVEIRTTHSLAYKTFGRKYAHKLKRPAGAYQNVAWTGSEVARKFGIASGFIRSTGKVITASSIGACVVATLARFEHSADETVDMKHVSLAPIPQKKQASIDFPEAKLKAEILKHAKALWEERLNTSSPVMITHDTYLKLYQLSKPDLSDYQMIYLDEYQDTNECVHSIAMMQNKSTLIAVGDKYQAIYCQPPGTKVKAVVGTKQGKGRQPIHEDKNIEDLAVGDLVVSYSTSKTHLHTAGKRITKHGSREYEDDLIVVSVDGSVTKYTKDHECIVKIGDYNKGKYVCYLMRKDNKFRVGVVPFFYRGGGFGPAMRAAAEGAESFWILGVHDRKEQALLQESVLSYKYGIPQTCFIGREYGMVNMDVELFWKEFDDLTPAAKRLLEDFGLSFVDPVWKAAEGKKRGNITTRVHFEIKAVNLFDGLEMAILSRVKGKGKIQPSAWMPIKTSKEFYQGLVYSLEVEDDHTYFADGVLTHNCWRGAVNMMERLDWPESQLTKSFRFGQKLADLANEILRDQKTLEYRTQMLGFEERDTEVLCGMEWWEKSKQHEQYTKLYRTNSNLIADAIEDISAGKKVALQVNTGDFIRCLQSGVALKQGNKSAVKHDIFMGFDNWKEFEDEATGNHEYGRLYRIITEGDVSRIISILENYAQPKEYEILYSTAHKAKGLEWDVVVLADDFPSPLTKDGSWAGLTQEEQNLLYVAATRAKKTLVKNSSIEEMLLHYEQKEEMQDDCAMLGITVRGMSILSADHLLPGDLERTLDTILGSDKELEAIESMQDDEIYPEGVDCGLTTRFSSMYNDSKLLPSFTGYVTRPIPAPSLEKQVELTMASEFGYTMTDMDRFIEGPVPDQNNDEACDKNHWSRAGAEHWHTPYED